MKKWIWAVIAAVVIIGLGAGAFFLLQPEKPQTVGILYREPAAEQDRQYRWALETAMQNMGYEVLVLDSDRDQAKQLQQIQKLLDRECKLLILEPVASDGGAAITQALQGSHIPVIFVDRLPEGDLRALNYTYVGHDAAMPGILQESLVQTLPQGGDLNGDGNVGFAVLTGPENSVPDMTYLESVKKTLKLGHAHNLLLTASSGTGDSAFARTKAMLREFGLDVEVILCASDALALEAARAAEEFGLVPGQDVFLVSGGTDGQALDAVQTGTVSGTVVRNQDNKLALVSEAAQKMLLSQPVESVYLMDYVLVTPEK